MDVSMTINGTIKVTMTPKTEVMKYLAKLIEDGATFEVSRPNNSTEIVFTKIKSATNEKTAQMVRGKEKTKDLRRSHPGKTGRKLKYGEPTVLIPVFYCPASKEAEFKKILRDKLDEYRNAYLASIG